MAMMCSKEERNIFLMNADLRDMLTMLKKMEIIWRYDVWKNSGNPLRLQVLLATADEGMSLRPYIKEWNVDIKNLLKNVEYSKSEYEPGRNDCDG